MERYRYEGPVKEFDRIVNENWSGETMAVSEEKARSNLAFRYKKSTGRAAASKISLPGRIVKV